MTITARQRAANPRRTDMDDYTEISKERFWEILWDNGASPRWHGGLTMNDGTNRLYCWTCNGRYWLLNRTKPAGSISSTA